MPFSHHSHSGQFCSHGKNTLEEMVQGAIKRKMQVFALTEHMPREQGDLYPEEVIKPPAPCGLRSYPAFRLRHCRPRTRLSSSLTPTSWRLLDYRRNMHPRLKSSSDWRLTGFDRRQCDGFMICLKYVASISSSDPFIMYTPSPLITIARCTSKLEAGPAARISNCSKITSICNSRCYWH